MVGAVAAGLPPIEGQVELKLRFPITTQVEFHFKAGDASGSAGSFRLGVGGNLVSGQIVASNRPVLERKAYDEPAIWSRARIDARRIELVTDSGMRPIEVITALGVMIHKTVFPPSPEERWLLARLLLARPLKGSDADSVSVKIERTIGKSMTRSLVAVSEFQLGTMDFILGRDNSKLT
jgi:hypothetical protein